MKEALNDNLYSKKTKLNDFHSPKYKCYNKKILRRNVRIFFLKAP